MIKNLTLLMLFLVGFPIGIMALSNQAEMLRQRQLELLNTDSTDAFTDVSERLKTILEEGGEEDLFHKTW